MNRLVPESSASAPSDHFIEELWLIRPFISPDTHTHRSAAIHTDRNGPNPFATDLTKKGEDGIRKLLRVINNDKAAGSVDSHREVIEITQTLHSLDMGMALTQRVCVQFFQSFFFFLRKEISTTDPWNTPAAYTWTYTHDKKFLLDIRTAFWISCHGEGTNKVFVF